MGRLVLVPDTNFLISYPDFPGFLAPARTAIHMAIPLPVLKELDRLRGRRHSPRAAAEDAQRGHAAHQALNRVHSIQQRVPPDFDYEIIRSPHVHPREDFDVQISDYAVHIARDLNPEDHVIFVTNDSGLPTILVNEAIRREGLRNLSVRTAEELCAEMGSFGTPAVVINEVAARIGRVKYGEGGVTLFITLTATDLKLATLHVAVPFYRQDGQPMRAASARCATNTGHLALFGSFTPPHAQWVERDLRLFVPFAELKEVARRRYGVHRIRFAVAVFADLGGDAMQRLAFAAEPSYALTVALRQWSCPEGILRRAA